MTDAHWLLGLQVHGVRQLNTYQSGPLSCSTPVQVSWQLEHPYNPCNPCILACYAAATEGQFQSYHISPQPCTEHSSKQHTSKQALPSEACYQLGIPKTALHTPQLVEIKVVMAFTC